VTGHGFEVTGDPADLPPGAKLIELNINDAVEAVARAIYTQISTRNAPDFDTLPAMERHNLCELALTAVMALAEHGWHPASAHAAIQAAMAEDETPETGMDPR
jgi:hypothetical protein